MPTQTNSYTQAYTLERGGTLIAVDALAALGTGLDHSQLWGAMPQILGEPVANVGYQMLADGTMTAFTADHEISSDGGTTWTKRATIDFVANPMGFFQVAPGVLNRFNVKTFTLNSATKASVRVFN